MKVFEQKTSDMTGNPSASNILAPPSFTVIPGVGPVPTSLPAVGWANVASSQMTGGEFYIDGKVGSELPLGPQLHLHARHRQRRTPARTCSASTSPSTRLHRPAGRTSTSAGPGGGLTADGYVRYVSASRMFRGGTLEPVPAYATLAGRLAYAIAKNTTVALSGDNLLQNHQVQTSGLLAERRVAGDYPDKLVNSPRDRAPMASETPMNGRRIADLPLLFKMALAPVVALVMLAVLAFGMIASQRHQTAALERVVKQDMASSLALERLARRISTAHGELFTIMTHQAGGIDAAGGDARLKALLGDRRYPQGAR